MRVYDKIAHSSSSLSRESIIMRLNRRIRCFGSVAAISFVLAGGARGQEAIKNVIPDVARPLPLSAVRLTGGPLKHAQDLDIDYLLKLEPDRMMAYYRKRAGLEPKAAGYTGWDGDGRNLTGHIAGHYLSAGLADVRRDGRRALQRTR
jgi:hypothetical protein